MTRARYDVYLNTPDFPITHVADLAVDEDGEVLNQVGFRYQSKYLVAPNAFSLDPAQLPLGPGEIQLQCRNGIPALIDDYLPDAWGRRVMVRLARARHQTDFNANSVIDSLALVGNSRIGALAIVSKGGSPQYNQGETVASIAEAELAAQRIDDIEHSDIDPSGLSLLYLANSGTGVGGARPKALLHDEKGSYLAKFNRQHADPYNNARVELACLRMARAAGLQVSDGYVLEGINGREVLLLERFDVTPSDRRHHLITVNGLLKETSTQRDVGRAFRYDMIAEQIARYAVNIEESLTQLLRLMLFNVAIHNTDDHERNFSLIHRQGQYQLAPAYDLVPSVTAGSYHAAGYHYTVTPPRPTDAIKQGKVFGLPKTIVGQISEQVIDAVSRWQEFAASTEVGEQDAERIEKMQQL
ncbi:MAG: type II toxin-antitoxin system HipA family toxin [Halieaceae bacterium]|jgi:serine/threonine-protein kinase HipA|nr:type II toxin-antitoxin system HipA family toxin [Halieaceae bacterium]